MIKEMMVATENAPESKNVAETAASSKTIMVVDMDNIEEQLLFELERGGVTPEEQDETTELGKFNFTF